MTLNYNSIIINAARQLTDVVFTPKLERAATMAERYGGAEWVADGSNLIAADSGAVIARFESSEDAEYLAEYDPASVRRATSSKSRNVDRMFDAVNRADTGAIRESTVPFMLLVREYSHRTGTNPDEVDAAIRSLVN